MNDGTMGKTGDFPNFPLFQHYPMLLVLVVACSVLWGQSLGVNLENTAT
jgi:hypothetical protein